MIYEKNIVNAGRISGMTFTGCSALSALYPMRYCSAVEAVLQLFTFDLLLFLLSILSVEPGRSPHKVPKKYRIGQDLIGAEPGSPEICIIQNRNNHSAAGILNNRKGCALYAIDIFTGGKTAQQGFGTVNNGRLVWI